MLFDERRHAHVHRVHGTLGFRGGLRGLGVGGLRVAAADRLDRLGVGVGLGVRLGVGAGVGGGVGMAPLPVHVDVLVSLLGPVWHVTVEFLLEEILPPRVGLISLLLLVPLLEQILEEGMLIGIDLLLLKEVFQPGLVVLLLEERLQP